MNSKAQAFGFGLLTVALIFIIALVATIDPIKEVLDDARGDPALNCPGTPDFNQTAFDNDDGDVFEKLNRRGTCFVTGIGMVWFVGGFFIALIVWLARNWKGRPKTIG